MSNFDGWTFCIRPIWPCLITGWWWIRFSTKVATDRLHKMILFSWNINFLIDFKTLRQTTKSTCWEPFHKFMSLSVKPPSCPDQWNLVTRPSQVSNVWTGFQEKTSRNFRKGCCSNICQNGCISWKYVAISTAEIFFYPCSIFFKYSWWTHSYFWYWFL